MASYSSKSLAVKYRPKTFSEIVGQSNITNILENQIKTKTFRNTVLFTGPAGCGKTTSARAFARLLNQGKGTPIEIDAASNNGVDNVRDIIVKAQQKSLDSEYKIFIIDECFKGDTLITTADGAKFIKDIKPGEYIQNALGYGKVTQVFRNKVLTNRICCVKINGVETITTVDHLYFTNSGWVSAQNLKPGDIVYANIHLSKLWERILSRTQGPSLQVLFNELSKGAAKSRTREEIEKYAAEILCNMWKAVSLEMEHNSNLFEGVPKCVDKPAREGVSYDRGVQNFERTKFSSYVAEQSDGTTGNTTKNDTNSEEQWNLECLDWAAWWQRSLHSSAINALRSIEQETDIRVCNTDKDEQDERVSYLLQSRPRLSSYEVGDRSGWQQPQIEKWLVKRLEENKTLEQFRVDSVEVYQRGSNDEYFERHFDRELLDSGELYFYDLEVDTHPSYFANGILVHNCHAISNAGWQAFLKLIEEPPANTVFIFCTTDPQKIPATIISRVQRFDFKRISFNQIVERLKYICVSEGYTIYNESTNISDDRCVSEQAIAHIAKLCDGGMRDGITSLDKCLAHSDRVNLSVVVETLGTVDYTVYFNLTNAIFNYEEDYVISTVENCYREGVDLKQFIKQYTLFLLDVCKYTVFKNFDFIQIPDMYEGDLNRYCSDNAKEFLKFLLDEINKLNSEIKWESSVKNIVELNLLLLTQPESA